MSPPGIRRSGSDVECQCWRGVSVLPFPTKWTDVHRGFQTFINPNSSKSFTFTVANSVTP